MKDILIIGGMGPQASIVLHQQLICRAVSQGATHGQDFPTITHLSIAVPEFIDSKQEQSRAVAAIKRRLYCLWRP